MSDTRHEMEFATVTKLAAVKEYLDALAEGVERHELVFHYGGQTLRLVLAEEVELEISARVKGGRSTIELEMSWPDSVK